MIQLKRLHSVAPTEFIAPLPLEECLQRLKAKTVYSGSTRLSVDFDRLRVKSYAFQLTRTIARVNITNKRVMAHGTLEHWDKHSTLVTCRPAIDYLDLTYTLPLILLVAGLVTTLMPFAWLSGFFIFLAVVALPFAYFGHLRNLEAHRSLVHMVDEMLREPLFLGSQVDEGATTLGDLLQASK